jgi:hypothetical protein
MKMNKDLDHLNLPSGYTLTRYNASMPESTDHYSMKWDGEWHITIEVFRDMGLAFASVLILIYVLVVGWFRSFIAPLIIMTPIPLTLVGIMPVHAILGVFFTATSMIGFIAGAGIIVRNSIILVDFIELRIRQGMPLAEAVIDAGATRFRHMLLTAAAVVVGASVILTDPIFQGLALSLIRLHRARLSVRKEMNRIVERAPAPPDCGKPSMTKAKRIAPKSGQRPTECRELFLNLSEYLDGKVEPRTCDQMRQHIDACPACVAFLRDLRAAIDRCRSLEVPCDSAVAPRLRSILTQEYLRLLGLPGTEEVPAVL